MIVTVLGVPVTFEAPPGLEDAVRRHYGDAATGEAEVGAGVPGGPRVRLEALAGPVVHADPREGLRFETLSPTRMRVVGPCVEAEADSAGGSARVRVRPECAADPETFGHGVLDTVTLFLVTARDRQPVHAAGVALGGRALLLAAPGGTGKSTLAYALLRSGCAVLADDAIYLQSDPGLAVWGRGTRISLPEDARERFPELGTHPVTRRADGRPRILVPLEGPLGRPAGVEPAGICLLERDGAVGVVERLGPDEAVREVLAGLDAGFDRFADTVRAPLTEVAARGAWRLRLPADAMEAADRVRSLVS